MQETTRQVTRRFKRDQPIDCRDWQEFTILTATYKDWTIRYVESAPNKLDTATPDGVGLTAKKT